MQIESPPLNDEHTDRDVDADLDADRAPWLGGTSRRASGFKGDQFPSDSLQTSGRITRTLALSSVAVLVGVGATLSWQMVGPWAQSATPPAPAVTSAELQAQLKPAALDLACHCEAQRRAARHQSRSTRPQARSDGAGHRDTTGSRAGPQSENFRLGATCSPACTGGGPCPATQIAQTTGAVT